MGFRVQGIDHVELRARDLGAAVAWYSRVFGLEEVQVDALGCSPLPCRVRRQLHIPRYCWRSPVEREDPLPESFVVVEDGDALRTVRERLHLQDAPPVVFIFSST